MATKTANLKLKESISADVTLARLVQIPGVVKIERLFPAETDHELASLYLVRTGPSAIDQVLAALRQDPDVEFAELQPERKLI